MIGAFLETIRSFKEAEYTNVETLINKKKLVPITVIMPAYNEQKRILNSALSVLQSVYQNLNFIIVNDGSTDETLALLTNTFLLYEVPPVIKQVLPTKPVRAYYKSKKYPNLVVIDKEHYGSADSVNVGVNACRTPLFITVDADTLLEPNSITRILFNFLTQAHCIAVGGGIYLLNECKIEKGKILSIRIPHNFVCGQQTCEYLRSFLYGRAGWNLFGGTHCYPGAFTLLEKKAVLEVGGYDIDNYSYDAEIILKLHEYMRRKKYPYKINYAINAFAFAEEPATFKAYWKQRNHWQRGLLRSVFRFKREFLNPKYGIVGLYTYPFFVLYEVFGPVIEFISYFLVLIAWYQGIINSYALLLFFILAWGYNAFLTMGCVLLNLLTFNIYRTFVDTINFLSLTILQMFGFRQFNALCCFFATIQYIYNRILNKPL